MLYRSGRWGMMSQPAGEAAFPIWFLRAGNFVGESSCLFEPRMQGKQKKREEKDVRAVVSSHHRLNHGRLVVSGGR